MDKKILSCRRCETCGQRLSPREDEKGRLNMVCPKGCVGSRIVVTAEMNFVPFQSFGLLLAEVRG